MGIADLTPLLKECVPNCFVETPAHNLNNRRMAFDGYNWIFTVLGISVKEASKGIDVFDTINPELVFKNVIRFFLGINLKLLNHKITPVWIWDSPDYVTPQKLETRDKRREARKKIADKKENIKEALSNMSVLERPTELINEFKKLQSTTFYFPSQKITELKDLCRRLGIPSITAEGEGEYLAACLAVERIVACVYSGDTDTIAMGVPFVTKNINKQGGELYIGGIFTPSILKTLDLDHQQFRELCYLLGCDFNKRVKGVGKKKALELMKKYKCIEKVLEHLDSIQNPDGTKKYDISTINHEKCKELLTPRPSGFIDKTKLLDITPQEYDEDLDKYNLRDLFETVLSRTRNFKPAENVPKN